MSLTDSPGSWSSETPTSCWPPFFATSPWFNFASCTFGFYAAILVYCYCLLTIGVTYFLGISFCLDAAGFYWILLTGFFYSVFFCETTGAGFASTFFNSFSISWFKSSDYFTYACALSLSFKLSSRFYACASNYSIVLASAPAPMFISTPYWARMALTVFKAC